MSSAVVFAYHNVGVRCLRVLLAGGVDVRLVVTHEDSAKEHIWFGSVQQLCIENSIPFITPTDPNTPEIEARIAALRAEFIFSFYYRQMLKSPLLKSVTRGAYNMHGSMLPNFRGRAPVNWAIINGARETGATLHQMNIKPDNGPVVDQFAVPILPDDNAQEVFDKVVVAAELCLYRSLPKLIDGTAPHVPQNLSNGAYYGGRCANDGRIDWNQNARRIHDLVRAVTYPFPGAFSDFSNGRLVLWRTRVVDDSRVVSSSGTIQWRNGHIEVFPIGGGALQILKGEFSGRLLDACDDVFQLGGLRLPE